MKIKFIAQQTFLLHCTPLFNPAFHADHFPRLNSNSHGVISVKRRYIKSDRTRICLVERQDESYEKRKKKRREKSKEKRSRGRIQVWEA